VQYTFYPFGNRLEGLRLALRVGLPLFTRLSRAIILGNSLSVLRNLMH
jgi:hypothetical protein